MELFEKQAGSGLNYMEEKKRRRRDLVVCVQNKIKYTKQMTLWIIFYYYYFTIDGHLNVGKEM